MQAPTGVKLVKIGDDKVSGSIAAAVLMQLMYNAVDPFGARFPL